MPNCPSESTPEICAKKAADLMANKGLIVLNPLGNGDVVIAEAARHLTKSYELIGRLRIPEDNVVLGCHACRRCIQMIEEDDGLKNSFL